MGRAASLGMTSVSERERQLRLRERSQPTVQPSLLEDLFRLLEGEGPWKINFDDLSGLARRIPDLRLPIDFQLHNCAFCKVAKNNPATLPDCVRNKHAVNRLVVHRKAGFTGQCHLGLTDIVEPLLVNGRALGTFYFGSVIVRGTERPARERILRYSRRKQIDPQPLLKELQRTPRVSLRDVTQMRERLQFTARLAARLVEAWGFPDGNERTGRAGAIWQEDRRLPITLQRVLQWVQAHYGEPVQLAALAKELRVHPDYLSRLFRQHLRLTFSEYLMRVRINHARRLLETGRYRAGEVAQRTGFADQAHFGKVFKRLTGVTPRQWVARLQA